MSSAPPPITPSERDNLPHWRADGSDGLVESLFLKLNLPERGLGLWLQFGARQMLPAAGTHHGHVMAVVFDHGSPAGHVALRERFVADAVRMETGRFVVEMGANQLRHGHTEGRLDDGAHRVAWELDFTTPHDSHRLFPWALLYRAPLPKTKALTPVFDGRFRGWLEIDGVRHEVRDARGMQGHNWGRQHGHEWVWLHGNLFSGRRGEASEAVLEGLSARVRVGPWLTPWLTMVHLRYGGELLTFDNIRLPFALRSVPDALAWTFTGTRGRFRIEGRARAPAERFVGVNYLDPDGTVTHCLNSGIADAALLLLERRRSGWRLLDQLESRGTSMLEVAVKDDLRGVRVMLP